VLVVKKRSGEIAVPAAGVSAGTVIMEDYVATHLVLLRSPLIAERAVEKLKNQDKFNKLPSLAEAADPVGAIGAALKVSREKDGAAGPNNIINMSYRCTVPEDCGVILNAIIESYKDFLDEKYRGFSDDTLALIGQGRDLLQKTLQSKREQYEEFRKTSPLIWKGRDSLADQQRRVGELEASRTTLLVRQKKLSNQLKDFEQAKADKLPRSELLALIAPRRDGQDKSQTQQPDALEQMLLPLRIQEQQLLEDVGPQHPSVIKVRGQIKSIKEIMAKATPANEDDEPRGDLLERYHVRLQRELQSVEREYGTMTDVLKGELQTARRLAEYEMQDDNLQSDILQSKQMCEGVIKRLTEMNMVRDGGGFDASSISRIGAGYKVAPNLLQYILGGAILGFSFGVGIAYLADFSDKGFRGADEIQRRLGLPVIGHIPLLSPDQESQRKIKAGEPTLDPYLCTQFRPRSMGAEAYRAVRTALYFSVKGGGHRVIQVTSPDMGDGKSTLVTNLGVCIAQSGKQTIIVDADLRRPRLHKMFGLQSKAGLAGAIAGQCSWSDAVHSTEIPGLFVLPCGPLPQNPSELLSSPRFSEILSEIRTKFDFVLVDTPPLLAVTDPCVVAPRVDCVVLTLRLSKKCGPQAERAREILATLGAKVLGVVVNGVTYRSGSGTYGGGKYEYTYSQNEYTSQADATEESYYDEGKTSGEPKRAGTARPAVRQAGALSWFQSLWM
jgi:capsular exopolysaccharide synthesis family protein